MADNLDDVQMHVKLLTIEYIPFSSNQWSIKAEQTTFLQLISGELFRSVKPSAGNISEDQLMIPTSFNMVASVWPNKTFFKMHKTFKSQFVSTQLPLYFSCKNNKYMILALINFANFNINFHYLFIVTNHGNIKTCVPMVTPHLSVNSNGYEISKFE